MHSAVHSQPRSPVQCYAWRTLAAPLPRTMLGQREAGGGGGGRGVACPTSRPLIIYTPPSGTPRQNGHAPEASRKRFDHGAQKSGTAFFGRVPKRKPKCSRGTHQGIGACRCPRPTMADRVGHSASCDNPPTIGTTPSRPCAKTQAQLFQRHTPRGFGPAASPTNGDPPCCPVLTVVRQSQDDTCPGVFLLSRTSQHDSGGWVGRGGWVGVGWEGQGARGGGGVQEGGGTWRKLKQDTRRTQAGPPVQPTLLDHAPPSRPWSARSACATHPGESRTGPLSLVFTTFAGPGRVDNPSPRKVRRREVLAKGRSKTVPKVPGSIMTMAVFIGFYNVSSPLAPLTTYHRSWVYTQERW